MTPELSQHIREKYPKIFSHYCELNIDDGWFDILDMLCANIQSHVDRSRRDRHDILLYNRALSRAIRGDFSTYERLNPWLKKGVSEDLEDIEPQLKIAPYACQQVVASQIKEKFGTLRFYHTGGDEVVDGMVRLAEALTSKVCENCGCPGESRSNKKNRWIRVLCEKHAYELGYIEDEDSISE